MSHKRKHIMWKKDIPRTATLLGRPMLPETELLPENSHFVERLVVGSLWMLDTAMTTVPFDSRTEPPPLPYLSAVRRYGTDVLAKVGTPAVYMGTTRVEELGRSGTPVRILRHTFLINGAKYMTTDLNTFVPT